ncbi:putative glucose dehydrogenase [Aspergillus taichungensis]|uniref:Putative glucose dehydrogenase n=1 Tax=Aspergillus taichungensis TaxID=482145 RepID=A0A2J5HGT7_9EURO|nr:putative glucose dehydrogenase [Aspergillus taichungensis]
MGRNPLSNPLHYASPQWQTGSPATIAEAQRQLQGYDYVIVGAGAAGSVLASQLSEDPHVTVLLLEAGGDNTKILESKAPMLFNKLFHTEHDWNYYTTEQPALASRRLYWPRGRMLGGSSSMNAMMYHHCAPSDFDEWTTVHGCQGWGYNDLVPYWRRMEGFTPNTARPRIDLTHRSRTGMWDVGYSWLTEIGEKGFLPACEDAGIPANPDVNTFAGTLGVTRFQTFIDPKGQRASLATAYLPAAVRRRPNLTIACHAHVTRLLVDRLSGPEPTVIGVELQIERGGPRFEVHARREVVLCGGAINTPQLLLLSGIGPAEELRRHDIPVVRESAAVGQNLKDHLCPTPIICKARWGTTLDYLANPLWAIPALARWKLLGSGPLTHNAGEAAAFFRSWEHHPFPGSSSERPAPEDNTSGSRGPDLEIVGAPMAYVHHGEEPGPDGASAFSLVPVGLRPKSKGSITLRTRDAFDAPIIDPKYLSDETDNDRNVLLAGIRVCLRIMRSPALQRYLEPVAPNDDIWSEWWPYSSTDIDRITDEQLLRWMEAKAFTLYHPVGTARMGPSPETSVVDLQCRVHGVRRLRVVDASVFPEQISGHPTATIAAMAYKLSDQIKRDYQTVRANL